MGAAADDVVRAARPRASRPSRDGLELTGLHRYNNADGTAWCYRIRCKHPDGRKWIRPMHAGDGKFVLGEPAIPGGGKPLYRPPHPAVETDPVYIVEGEACADALAGLGLTAVTSGSATSAPAADWSALRDRPVRIWPDHDTAGTDYADAVERILLDQGCTVSRIDAASLDLPDGGDCVDWLAAHPAATADDVQLLPDLVKIDRDKPGHRDTAPDNGLAVPDDPTRLLRLISGLEYALPPFGRAVEQALNEGRHPNVYLFAGPGRDAWGLARARQSVCGPASALVLPPGTDPASYRWPALPDLVVDMTGLAGEAVQRLARALVRDGVGLAYLLDADRHERDLRVVAKAGSP